MVSERELLGLFVYSVSRLNPCCGGRWSQRIHINAKSREEGVLILVVVEDGLRARHELFTNNQIFKVLILVVVEDGLRGLLHCVPA